MTDTQTTTHTSTSAPSSLTSDGPGARFLTSLDRVDRRRFEVLVQDGTPHLQAAPFGRGIAGVARYLGEGVLASTFPDVSWRHLADAVRIYLRENPRVLARSEEEAVLLAEHRAAQAAGLARLVEAAVLADDYTMALQLLEELERLDPDFRLGVKEHRPEGFRIDQARPALVQRARRSEQVEPVEHRQRQEAEQDDEVIVTDPELPLGAANFSVDVLVRCIQREGFHAFVAQTGGGVATVYAGRQFRDAEGEARYWAVAGPGTYGWGAQDSYASLAEFSIGADLADDPSTPDTYTDADAVGARTIADLARLIAAQCALPVQMQLDADTRGSLGFDSSARSGSAEVAQAHEVGRRYRDTWNTAMRAAREAGAEGAAAYQAAQQAVDRLEHHSCQ